MNRWPWGWNRGGGAVCAGLIGLVCCIWFVSACAGPPKAVVRPLAIPPPTRGERPAEGAFQSGSSVKEVTPAPTSVPRLALPERSSKRDYIRSRFPGKKVVFPEEIPQAAENSEYHVGANDVLSIQVWNHADLSAAQVAVRGDGAISLPLVGTLPVAGLTLPQLESRIRRELDRFIEKPQVSVLPSQIVSQRVFLLGQMRKPGGGDGAARSPFVLRGGCTLLEALADLEFHSDADLSASYVARGDLIIPVDLKRLVTAGDESQNVLLKAGDRVVIPGPMKEVNLLGEVQAPGKYKVNRDGTLLDALSLGKGVRRETADIYTAYVARNRRVMPVNLKKLLDLGEASQNMMLEDGDVVYVPHAGEKKYYVLGEVSRPGVMYFKEPVDLVEAIAQAGGFLVSARRTQVVVARGDIQSPQLFEVDLMSMVEGKSFDRFTLQKGDIVFVPRTAIADWNVFLNQLLPTFQGVVLVDLLRRW